MGACLALVLSPLELENGMLRTHFRRWPGRLLTTALAMASLVAACVPATATPLAPRLEPDPTVEPSATAAIALATANLQPSQTTPTPQSLTATIPALPARPVPPKLGSFDPASVSSIRLSDYPVIPVIGPGVVALYRAGLAHGNNPRVFSKLGDCMTDTAYFLVPFDLKTYDLGPYKDLQAVIDQFAGVPARQGDWQKDSFATMGLAAAQGFNVAGPLDPTWANPQWCNNGESPAACEYRVARPSVAIIMFGTNDATYTEPPAYDYYLRTLVALTLDNGVVPLLNTFPTRPEAPEKSLLMNQIVVKVAADYSVPLVNLNRALEALPNHGVDPQDTIHLSVPSDKRVDVFSAQNLQAGFTVRNLVTLQALQAVLQAVK